VGLTHPFRFFREGVDKLLGNLLRIEQNYGRIGLDIQPAQLSIQQPKASIKMHQTLPKLEIERTPLEIHIDQQDCWNEVGLKDPLTLSNEIAQIAKQAGLEGIGRIVEEGNRLAKIEAGGNPVVEIAAEVSNPPPCEFNIDFVPKSRPKIDFTGGELHFQAVEGKFEWKAIPNKPIIEATQPKVTGYMLQWPSLTIEYLGNNLDTRW